MVDKWKEKRVKLDKLLNSLPSAPNVYFNPPATVKMRYPAIRYELDYVKSTYSDNKVYNQQRSYRLTVITKDPDSPLIAEVASLPTCAFESHYVTDGLIHDVFTIDNVDLLYSN